MARISCFEQHLAAAVSHFGLLGGRVSALILSAYYSHTLFVQVFSLWFENRTEARSLPSSFLSKQLHQAEASTIWETPAGLSARAVLLPVIGHGAAEVNRYLCIPRSLGFQRKIWGNQAGHFQPMPSVFHSLLKC